MKKLIRVLMVAAGVLVISGSGASADDQGLIGGNTAVGTDNAKISNTNELSVARDGGTAVSGKDNLVANDFSEIGAVDFAVSSADLELVNIVGIGNTDTQLNFMEANDMQGIFLQHDVGVQAANFSSGNFNNQAVQAQITVSVSNPGFLHPFSSP